MQNARIMDDILKFIEEERKTNIEDLSKLISYKTVSANKESEVFFNEAAKFIKKLMEKAGIENVKLINDFGDSVIYGEKINDKSLPTIIIYAHYDVQPAEPLELWKTDPYKLEIKNGRLFGRGVSDDKALLFSTIKAVEIINRKNLEFKYNIKFMFEPSEEDGSEELNKMFSENNKKLDYYKNLYSATTLLACDSSMISEESPSISVGVRGVIAFDLTVIGPNRDIHSGAFGGFIGNPIHELSRLISSLHGEDNHITIDGFYEGVETTNEKKEMSNKLNFDTEFYKKDLEVNDFVNEKGFTCRQACRIRPTIEVNGIFGGYTEKEGGKTIIPSESTAKFTCRLVDKQNPDKIFKLFSEYIAKHIKPAFKFKIKRTDVGSCAVSTDLNCKEFKNMVDAYEKEYKKDVVYIRSGGSIPILSLLNKILGCDIVFVGFGGPNSNNHGPNENYSIRSLDKGIMTLVRYLRR